METTFQTITNAMTALVDARNTERNRLNDRNVFNPATRPAEYIAQEQLATRIDEMLAEMTKLRNGLVQQ
jgi:hypothetical protein